MRPVPWTPPIELSANEQVIVKRIRRAKLFIFLREHRHEIFDTAFQEELADLYQDSPHGQPPVAPALLARAPILQAYTRASDDEVIEASVMDRSFQLVLDCLDTEEAPCSKGTRIAFRQRLIQANMDRRLIECTIEVAGQAGAFGVGPLRHEALAVVLAALSAKDRRISIEDAQMRHGRKSRSVRVDGYQRHVLHDLDSGLVRAVGITPANVAQASVTEAIQADLLLQQAQLAEPCISLPRSVRFVPCANAAPAVRGGAVSASIPMKPLWANSVTDN